MESGITIDLVFAIVDLICIVVLLGKWIKHPQWRSPIIFTIICQITLGTIAVISNLFMYPEVRDYFVVGYNPRMLEFAIDAKTYSWLYFFCWSNCVPLFVLAKLLQAPVKNNLVATAITLPMFALVAAVTYGLENARLYEAWDNFDRGILLVCLFLHLAVVWLVTRKTDLAKKDQDNDIRFVKYGLVTFALLTLELLLGAMYIPTYYYLSPSSVFSISLLPLTVALWLHNPIKDALLNNPISIALFPASRNSTNVENQRTTVNRM